MGRARTPRAVLTAATHADPSAAQMRARCRGHLRASSGASLELLQLLGSPACSSCLRLGLLRRELGANKSPTCIPLAVSQFFKYLLFWCLPCEMSQLSALDTASRRSWHSGRALSCPPRRPLG